MNQQAALSEDENGKCKPELVKSTTTVGGERKSGDGKTRETCKASET